MFWIDNPSNGCQRNIKTKFVESQTINANDIVLTDTHICMYKYTGYENLNGWYFGLWGHQNEFRKWYRAQVFS